MDSLVDINKNGISAFTPFAQINPQVIIIDSAIPTKHNAISIGPLTIESTITIELDSNWIIQ